MDIEKYQDMGFSGEKLEQIKIGIEDGLTENQINLFANPEYSEEQMTLLRIAITHGNIHEGIEFFHINQGREREGRKMEQKTINLKGYLTGDIQVNEFTKEDGSKFKVANFSIVKEDENGEKHYTNLSAFNKKAEELENLKKGDLVKIFGTKVQEKDDEGKIYDKVHVLKSELIQSLEERREGTINLNGHLTGDIKVNEFTKEDGTTFKVANFSIVKEDENGEKHYTNLKAFNQKAEEMANLKKGDYIKVFGKKTQEIDDEGNVYDKVNVLASTLILSLEQKRALDENAVNIEGYLTSDIEVKEITKEDGATFKVANFATVKEDENGEKHYTNYTAFNQKAEEMVNLKKGDYIKVFGKHVHEQGEDGKVYDKVNVLASNLIQSLEERKTLEKTSEAKKSNDMSL